MIFTQKFALQTPSKVYFDNLIIKVLPDFIGLRGGQRPGKDLPTAKKGPRLSARPFHQYR